MKDADEGAHEVIRVSGFAEITAFDGALHEPTEGAVDDAACAFNEARRAPGNGVHGGHDEELRSDVVNEQEHPGTESFERGQFERVGFSSGDEFFYLGAEDGFDQSFSRGKVAVEGAGPISAWRAIWSMVASAPCWVKAWRATSRMRSRLRCASTRGRRGTVSFVACLMACFGIL